MIAVMQAASDGKEIEYRNNDQLSNGWKPCPQPSWNWIHCEYRVKPEPKLRPYANAQEFLSAMKEHGPCIYSDGLYNIVLQFDDYRVMIGKIHLADLSFGDLLECTWQDGTPCGVVEE